MTKIQWTHKGETKGETWNPLRGCSRVSEGCRNCYAERDGGRFCGEGMPYHGVVELGPKGPRWTGEIRLLPKKLDQPLRWRKPRTIFVNSMSDLFHEKVPDEFIAAVFGVMAAAPQHTYQVLTKRPERMREWFRDQGGAGGGVGSRKELFDAGVRNVRELLSVELVEPPWPLPNVWLGVSVEDQATANARIPLLLDTPAAVRFVSAEPLLGPVDLRRWVFDRGAAVKRMVRAALNPEDYIAPCLDWVIVGGESGPGARGCDLAWVRSIVFQCREAGVPVFVKQLGACASDPLNGVAGAALRVPEDVAETLISLRLRDRKGGDPDEWPQDLRVREFPA